MTNNLRVQIALLVNSTLLASLAFGEFLTEKQIAAVMIPVNAALYLVQLLTFKQSPKRVEE